MRPSVLVLLGFVFVSAMALADPPPSNNSAAAQHAVAQTNRRVAQHQAEVDHLQQDLGKQESASQAAAERLQQQDRTIEDLKRQLKAAQDATKPPSVGH